MAEIQGKEDGLQKASPCCFGICCPFGNSGRFFFVFLFVVGFSFSATRLVYYLERYILNAEYLRESVEDEFSFFSHVILLILIKR